MNKRVGLAVADMQTFSRGHNLLLNEMRQTCDECIIGIGSIDLFDKHGHPFTAEQRIEMIKTIHGDFFKFVLLKDIDTEGEITEWYDYVSSKIKAENLPEPTDYFTGSEVDAKYYFHVFADTNDIVINRGITKIYSRLTKKDQLTTRLHIIDRHQTDVLSGRDIRTLIEMRDNRWKLYVPDRIHEYVEYNYPPKLRFPIEVKDVSQLVNNQYPVGTRFKINGQKEILEKKDDGKIRPLRSRDEKNEYALEAIQALKLNNNMV